ncbi:hypothetical protein CTAYLR_004622 [Chrysophaeum taylorii]|uniref:4-hydroxy-3-methylbut-2-en-1-yl diphosphate synthase (ferredoxin), chloroplastic n=1 Tax=Chrysophaeum taylorii TaxID=2483200 RepID=A0AAD7UPM7_9STRA|nr:hypothetical protein CTAYLR_004622 [Chrysophaeum taylorii]
MSAVEEEKYCVSRTVPTRRETRSVSVGPVAIGSDGHSLVCQTMSTTDTRDVEASVAQILRCKEAGADMVRLTVQGLNEAKKAAEIRAKLDAEGVDIPLVADIHFHPKAALLVAEAFEKIRVNPGNFADGRKKFDEINYDSPEEFEAERAYIEEIFTPLVLKCKEKNRAMRIGTNHGSLSARIMSFYGDSPSGMVESALEFAHICRKNDYHNFVFSMKASNPVVMVQAYRLLAAKMYELGWDYPLHLGVTEAGEGEDGRMKSAIGIGALLADGLGDTIRVSLTEDPEFELEPCRTLAALGREAVGPERREKAKLVPSYDDSTTRSVVSFEKRRVQIPSSIHNDRISALHRDGSVISVVEDLSSSSEQELYARLGLRTAVGMPIRDVASSDSIFLRELPVQKNEKRILGRLAGAGVGILVPFDKITADDTYETLIALVDADDYSKSDFRLKAARLTGLETEETLAKLVDPVFAVLDIDPSLSQLHASRRIFHILKTRGATFPVIHRLAYDARAAKAPDSGLLRKDLFILRMGMDGGSLLVDGLGDGVMVDAPFDLDFLRSASFGLLQGCRMRNVKTEFVSCPSCGRTLFDLQEVTAQISERTGHLPGVTIAIMGCIVNGPGEMADADFGYVGGAPGKVDLYVGKEVVQRGIPNEVACDALIQLIKDNDRWVEPTHDSEEEDLLAAA